MAYHVATWLTVESGLEDGQRGLVRGANHRPTPECAGSPLVRPRVAQQAAPAHACHANGLPRPRLLTQLDDEPRPLTLIVAPAGFGKSTAVGEWAYQEPAAAWLTADADDASLPRFWAHLREALAATDPSFGDLVDASFALPHRATAGDLGRMLADELLDAAAPVRLVIDDFHLVPESETHAFLGGLFEIVPPGFRCVITARTEPPLPLSRLRLRGVLREISGADLLFTGEETRALVTQANPGATDQAVDRHSAHLWHQTRGWAAGLRLAALVVDDGPISAPAVADVATTELLDTLLDEMLAGRSPEERTALMRAALPEAFIPRLVAALIGTTRAASSDDLAATSAIRFALAADMCRLSPRFGKPWLEFHPLFRDGLQRRLEQEESKEGLASLHTCAAEWLEADGLHDAAIAHWLAAGEHDAAVALVEQAIQPAFDREDWAAVARWLALLPDDIVWERLPLLLAKGWIAHLRGRATQLMEIVLGIEARLAPGDLPEAERRALHAELDLLKQGSTLPVQLDPDRSLAVAQEAMAHVPASRRYQQGLAWMLLGLALQSTGHHDAAVERLAWWSESQMDHVDAGSVRGLQGLLFVHGQAGHLTRVESIARTVVDVGSRHRLQLAAAWGHRFLGDVLYERNDLDGAIAQYAAVTREYEHFNLTGVREVYVGLALAHVAAGRTGEAWRALQRVREILLEVGALEHLPALDAAEAYLAWRTGDAPRAERWARASTYGVDDATLYMAVHPAFIRAVILCSSDDPSLLTEAMALLEALRQRAAGAHFIGPLVRIEALRAIAQVKQGVATEALASMRRSLATGQPQGYLRTYLDLLPAFATELSQLATSLDVPDDLRSSLTIPSAGMPVRSPAAHSDTLTENVTEREREVLAALAQRLSYKEIADQLFISPLTVKRHASSVYGKLGVAGRNDAVRRARELGWLP